jgi:ribosomal subunit interface protein
MEPSSVMEADVRQRADKLDRIYDRIVSCRVVIEAPHRRHHKGKLYAVKIDISVPGKEIVVNSNGVNDHGHEDAYIAIRHAFDAAARQLEAHAAKQRGQVKNHAAPGGAIPAKGEEEP